MNQSFICPSCGSPKTIRIERTMLEKIKCFFKPEKGVHKKYACTSCLQIVLVGQPVAQAQVAK